MQFHSRGALYSMLYRVIQVRDISWFKYFIKLPLINNTPFSTTLPAGLDGS